MSVGSFMGDDFGVSYSPRYINLSRCGRDIFEVRVRGHRREGSCQRSKNLGNTNNNHNSHCHRILGMQYLYRICITEGNLQTVVSIMTRLRAGPSGA